ncbi:RNA-binding protein [Candidatus Epulonipiscium fishelsonii]|uniref:RNA-binding protein n=1 Tax=Candidatus Epulonipiscium fishelsonii TaxID=77094 RepID=A0ACC8XAD7_9FIRM|nr:RNA-binding protein [Epulopiscium sp. SCG-B11WGA-EpuloA1]ONI43510.1 RNA-binding protein [Epulopiscium sp. SCG-B05WGA-EpuloA1]
MLELGKVQNLMVIQESDFGLYLAEDQDELQDKVLLPNAEIPEGTKLGDKIDVFLYKDTQDRIVATCKEPLLKLGEVAFLEVAEVTDIGAFLKWGLIKDLLLPFKEQLVKVEAGKSYVVGLYIDKTDRLCATMKVYNLLSSESPYIINKMTRGLVYRQTPEHGVFVAVDGKYHGLIINKEIYREYNIGDWIDIRIKNVRPDGKLELTERRQVNSQMEIDANQIMTILKKEDGFLPLNDKSNPNIIKEKLKMSKASFKRAVGRLLKEGVVEFANNGIKIRF